jgi:hypothetical protein
VLPAGKDNKPKKAPLYPFSFALAIEQSLIVLNFHRLLALPMTNLTLRSALRMLPNRPVILAPITLIEAQKKYQHALFDNIKKPGRFAFKAFLG